MSWSPHPVAESLHANLKTRVRRRERGSTALEFALVIIAAMPLFFGTVGLGITMGRGIQAIQVTRDVGHMFGLNMDFSQTGAQLVVAKLAQDYSLNATSGTAVLIFSRVQKISATNCSAATVPCNNQGYAVFTYRYVMGNSSLRSSDFGTPPAGYVGSNGSISATNYLQYTTVRAANFDTVMNLADGEYTSMVEGFFRQPDINFLQPGFSQANQGTYVRVFF